MFRFKISRTRGWLTLLAGVAVGTAVLVAQPSPAQAAATTIDLENVATAISVNTPDAFKVTARETGGGIDTAYAGTITFSASCGDCFTVSPNDGPTGANAKKYTFDGSQGGDQDFNLTWTSTGTDRTFIAQGTLSNNGSNVDSQSDIDVSSAPADAVHLEGVDTAITVNTADPITVTLKNGDATDTAYTGTVTFSASCGADCFTITPNNGAAANAKKYTFVGSDGGTKAFTLTWSAPGTHSLTVSAPLAGGGEPVTDTQSGIAVTSADATTVTLSGVDPSPRTHAPDAFTVAITNAQGEPVTNYTGTITFSTPNCATEPFTVTPNNSGANAHKYTFVAADQGTKNFTLTWLKPGTCTFTVTAPLSGDATDTDAVSVAASNRPAVRVIVTGASQGGGPHVQALRISDLTPVHSFFAYTPGFLGGVNVASGDVNGDGWDDIITGAGPGGGPHVRVFDGVNLAEIHGLMVYDKGFSGGVSVAAGDVNGDGKDDIITAPGSGGGPHVRIFSGADGSELFGFMAYAGNFHNGVNIAAANLDADAAFEIVTGAGPGGGPHVRYLEANGSELAGSPSGGFMAYAPTFTGGVFVGAHRDGNNVARIATGAGPGGGRHLRVFNTVATELMGRNVGPGTEGVVPTLGNLDGDADDEILVSAARGTPVVQRFELSNIELNSFAPYNAGVGVRTAIGAL